MSHTVVPLEVHGLVINRYTFKILLLKFLIWSWIFKRSSHPSLNGVGRLISTYYFYQWSVSVTFWYASGFGCKSADPHLILPDLFVSDLQDANKNKRNALILLQLKTRFFLLFLLDEWWRIRSREAQKLTDPAGPDPDPEHWFFPPPLLDVQFL